MINREGIWLLFTAWACLMLAGLPACKPGDSEREKLREELDEEFEKETGDLIEESERLTALLDKLVVEHEKLDEKHKLLDVAMKGKTVFPEHDALQKKHLEWEGQHQTLMSEVKDLIQRFEARRQEHEKMEEGHGDVPLDQVREEHEKFERDLEAFRDDFTAKIEVMEKAGKQMTTIFKEHEMLKEKYGKLEQ